MYNNVIDNLNRQKERIDEMIRNYQQPQPVNNFINNPPPISNNPVYERIRDEKIDFKRVELLGVKKVIKQERETNLALDISFYSSVLLSSFYLLLKILLIHLPMDNFQKDKLQDLFSLIQFYQIVR